MILRVKDNGRRLQPVVMVYQGWQFQARDHLQETKYYYEDQYAVTYYNGMPVYPRDRLNLETDCTLHWDTHDEKPVWVLEKRRKVPGWYLQSLFFKDEWDHLKYAPPREKEKFSYIADSIRDKKSRISVPLDLHSSGMIDAIFYLLKKGLIDSSRISQILTGQYAVYNKPTVNDLVKYYMAQVEEPHPV
jgi:hypothetical protein